MQRYLDNLRSKPKVVRAQAAFLFAGTFTGILFLVWIVGLGDRIATESVDPTIAEYMREQDKKESVDTVDTKKDSGIANLFGQLRRGAAAVIFNKDSEVVEDEKSLEDKVIDINALIANPPVRKHEAPMPADQDAVPAGDVQEGVGSVILIGTTTSQKSPENDG